MDSKNKQPPKKYALTSEEKSQIMGMLASHTIEDIAEQLNRKPKIIIRFCELNGLSYITKQRDSEYFRLELKLKTRPYWNEVKEQFTESELRYFISMWVQAMKQFNEDVQYSEEIQIKQWITLEIMANKVLRDRKSSQMQIDRLEALLDKLYAKAKKNSDDVDLSEISSIEQQLAMLRNAQSTYTSEHSKILQRIEKIQSELKASRADRIKRVDDSKNSWAGLLKLVEDEEHLRRLGEEAALLKLAKDAAKKRLSTPHRYMDGKIDQPYLNADNAIDWDSNPESAPREDSANDE